MMLMKRFRFIVLLWLCALSPIWAAPRLAVLDFSKSKELEPLLVAELSKSNEIEMVERNEIDLILKEKNLAASGRLEEQLSAAKMLRADGLLILETVKLKEGEVLSMRLTASGPGVVLGSFLFPIPKDDAAAFANDVSVRFAPLLKKLAVKREQAVPISLLNLRCSLKSGKAEQLESQLTFLLANRLIAQPELFVLERWRLGEAAFEKALDHVDDGAFWSGSSVVDGEIETFVSDPEKVTVRVYVRPAQGEVQKVEASGGMGNLPQMANDLAARLTVIFKKQPATSAWDPVEESRQYLRETRWAFNNKLFHVGRAAMESAWALGNREPKIFVLRVKIYAALAYPDTWEPAERAAINVREQPERIRYAQMALDYFEEVDRHPIHAARYYDKRVYVGCDVLKAVSRVLRNAFEKGIRKDDSVAVLRASVRKHYALVLSWLEPDAQADSPKQKWMWGPNLIAASYHSYWYDTPEECVRACHELLRWRPSVKLRFHAADMREYLMKRGLQERIARGEVGIPWLIDWNSESQENANLVWTNFVKSLVASGDNLERLDGLMFQYATDAKEGRKPKLKELMEVVWTHRKEIIDARLTYAYVGNLYRTMNAMGSPDAGDREELHGNYRVRWLVYFMENATAEDEELIQQLLWRNDLFSEADASAVYNAWLVFQERMNATNSWSSSPDAYQRLAGDMVTRFPQLVKKAANALVVDKFWVIPELGELPSFVEVQWNTGRLWVCVASNDRRNGTLYGIELPSFKVAEKIPLPSDLSLIEPVGMGSMKMPNSCRFVASEKAFYIKTKAKDKRVHRYDRKTKKWQILPIPEDGSVTALMPHGDDLYFGMSGNCGDGEGSGVFKWVAATEELQVISNNRRRPARNQFDDTSGWYAVNGLFPGPQGRLGAVVNFEAHLYKEETGKWEPLSGEGKSFVYPLLNDQTALLMAKEGAAGIISTSEPSEIQWYRGETPVSVPKNKGVLAATFRKVHLPNRLCDVEATMSYADERLWITEPRSINAEHVQKLQWIDWANPEATSKPVTLDLKLPDYLSKQLEQKDKTFTSNSMDGLRILATKEGVVFWEFGLPGFWFVPTAEMDAASAGKRK